MTLLGDERLATLAAAGDASAFAAIFARYQQPLVRYCAAILGSPHDAADAVQNTMIGAMRGLPRREHDGPLKPWLYRIAHNEAVSLMRTRRPFVGLDEEGALSIPAPELDTETRERVEALFNDLRELPERQRGALLMRELCGLSYDEIGVALEASSGSVRQSVFEARLALSDIGSGRDEACETIRRTISGGDRRALRARRLRGHLRACESCRGFEATIDRRRRDLAALGPWLSGATLAGAGAGAALGGGAVAGGIAAGGALTGGASVGTGLLGGAVAFKGAVAAIAAVAVAGGAVELSRHTDAASHKRGISDVASVSRDAGPGSDSSSDGNGGSGHGGSAGGSSGAGSATGGSGSGSGSHRSASTRHASSKRGSGSSTHQSSKNTSPGTNVDLGASPKRSKSPVKRQSDALKVSVPKAPKSSGGSTGPGSTTPVSSTTGSSTSTPTPTPAPAPAPTTTPVSNTGSSSGSSTSGTSGSATAASTHLPFVPTADQVVAMVHQSSPYVPAGVDDIIRKAYPFK